MTLYLTPQTTPKEIREAHISPHVHAVKLYPHGSTTQSHEGIEINCCPSSLEPYYPVFDMLQQTGLILSIHGEIPDPKIDVFHREEAFVKYLLTDLVVRFPRLRIVLEHITTKVSVQFIQDLYQTT